jgi:3-methylcrotonyl-CoA carboxylase alpha subunit
MFTKILIANRGEIACRVIKTAREMGIKTVAVYSDADENAMHVQAADEAVYIGKSAATESYLCVDKIIEAAKDTGAEAVHPGYGFLSENANFVKQCGKNGIVFIGPSIYAIEIMGSKSESKKLMEKAGVPTLPGYHGEKQEATFLQKQADAIGYPVLIKAVAGGGGKGMKLVEKSADFKEALLSAQREGKAGFGNSDVLLEKYLVEPRHIELQVFADNHGNTIHLCERDCSLQRRHQKVLEEAPAPHMTETLRKKMGEAAVNAAKSVKYSGAGTVEFLMDKNDDFYFMEMNTRLQVEHPITEMITGVDLVEWQLRVANDEKLPAAQKDIKINGHAFESRIYAEAPRENFLPSSGKIQLFTSDENARLDTGVATGDEISPYYDPMIAKLIVWDKTRAKALQKMATALENTHVLGLQTNVNYLHAITQNEDFSAAKIDTALLEKHHDTLTAPLENTEIISCLAFMLKQQEQQKEASPWNSLPAWRLSTSHTEPVHFMLNGKEQHLSVTHLNQGYAINGKTVSALLNDNMMSYEIDGKYHTAIIKADDDELYIAVNGESHHITPYRVEEVQGAAFSGNLTAPTSGTVIQVNAKAGEQVTAGSDLVILEAMKTEYRISAPKNGKIETVHAKKGDHVNKDSLLIHMTTDADEVTVNA